MILQQRDAAQAWATERTHQNPPSDACLGLRLPREELEVDLNNNNNQGARGRRQVSTLKTPPGVLLF